MLAASIVQNGWADPASDALAQLNELSREAVQTREAVSAAQRDVDRRLADQAVAEERHRADMAAVDAANAELGPHQAEVGQLAAITYMSGGTGQFVAVLSATSPQDLIDRLSLQKAIAGMAADQMKALRAARIAPLLPLALQSCRPLRLVSQPSEPHRCAQIWRPNGVTCGVRSWPPRRNMRR